MTQPITPDDPISRSADVVAGNIDQLKVLFPEAFTEGKLDFEVLKQLLGSTVDEREEKYGLSWHGKRKARQLALTPSTGTLRPAPDESVDWDTTQNLMIEGDNLEVLKLLQKSYAGKVKLIYIDPPYNTGGDFVYPDDFTDSIKNYQMLTGQIDTDGRAISSNPESSGRYHTDWLNMLYPRLRLARSLLSDTGIVAIHIDEHEVNALALIMRELFGEENELGVLIWDKRNPKGDARGLSYQHEAIVFFARNSEELYENAPLKRMKRNVKRMLEAAKSAVASTKTSEEAELAYRRWMKEQTSLSGGEAMYDRISKDGRVFRLVSMAWPNKKKAPDGYFKPLIHPVSKKPCPVPERGWRNPPDTMRDLLAKGVIAFGQDETTQPQRVYFLDENIYENVPSIFAYGGSDDDRLKEMGIPFDQPKPLDVAAAVIEWCSAGGDVVMDFFAGSGTVGHAVQSLAAMGAGNRRYILTQIPEPLDEASADQKAAAAFCKKLGKPLTIAEITKERLRRASSGLKAQNRLFSGDTGFRVFKLDESNIRAWNPKPDDLAGTLTANIEHLKPDRTELDVLYELLLKLGLDLCVPIEKKKLAGKDVHAVGGGTLMVCLAKKVTRDDVEALAQGLIDWHKQLAPVGDTTLVFRDSGFEDDVAKSNLAAILVQNGFDEGRIRSL